jgi:hypothetical protein
MCAVQELLRQKEEQQEGGLADDALFAAAGGAGTAEAAEAAAAAAAEAFVPLTPEQQKVRTQRLGRRVGTRALFPNRDFALCWLWALDWLWLLALASSYNSQFGSGRYAQRCKQ